MDYAWGRYLRRGGREREEGRGDCGEGGGGGRGFSERG